MKYLEDEMNVIKIIFSLRILGRSKINIKKKFLFLVKRYSKYFRGLAKCGMASYV